jgi:ADP-heptose:LPS heptosyltransferase
VTASHFNSLLVIRRDNIGDLACTTPFLSGLRRRYPHALIAALVNSYNSEVLAGNPDIDRIYAYTKAKHRPPGESLLKVYAKRLQLFSRLRRTGFDCAILAAPGFQRHSLQLARFAGAKKVLGFVSRPGEGRIDLAVPYGMPDSLHEVEDVWRLGRALGIEGTPPRMCVFPDAGRIARLRTALAASGCAGGPLVALHISARKASQRWPVACYAALAQALHARHRATFLILWAPGSAANPMHPGDDEKAAELARLASGLPVLAWPTPQLGELIAALAVSDAVVCADGGAMHLAAALAKPLVCLFGDSSPSRWRPWGTEHRLLQPPSRDVADITPEQVALAFDGLSKR